MSIAKTLAGLAMAAAMVGGAPSAAYADFPYTCDSAVCFATWCVDNFGDCRDGSPSWIYCEPGGDACWGCTGDIACYALYCTIVYSPVRCVT
jgi:hypothetical protein